MSRLNDAADRRDIYTCTQIINGGQNNAADRASRYNRALAMGDRLLTLVGDAVTTATPVAAVTPTGSGEFVLNYDHSIAPQERFYDCAAASAQLVLNAMGIIASEDEMIRECHTTENGTDYVGLVEKALNGRVPDARYVSVYINDPPSQAEKDAMWKNISTSVLNGYGVVMNWVVPPGNRPKSIKGGVDLAYHGGGVTFHYVTALGVDTAEKAIWVGDPGFKPFGAWITADQCATLIAPKGYTYATGERRTTAPGPTATPARTATSTVQPDRGGFKSVSPYRNPGEGAIGGVEVFTISDDGMIHAMYVENGAQLGDPDCVYRVIRSAAGRGADTSEAFKRRARAVLSKVPRADLQAVLESIQRNEPELLQALTGRSA